MKIEIIFFFAAILIVGAFLLIIIEISKKQTKKIDIEKCIGCGICRKLCPKGDVISMVPKMIGGESE